MKKPHVTPAQGVKCDVCEDQAQRWYRDTAVPVCRKDLCARVLDVSYAEHAEKVRQDHLSMELEGKL